jgi:hypothetical protein
MREKPTQLSQDFLFENDDRPTKTGSGQMQGQQNARKTENEGCFAATVGASVAERTAAAQA